MQGLAPPLHPAKALGALPHTFGKENCGLLLRSFSAIGDELAESVSVASVKDAILQRSLIADAMTLRAPWWRLCACTGRVRDAIPSFVSSQARP